MRVLCVGHCSYDIICPVEAYPQEDSKYRIDERIDSGGGSAANAAFLLGKWGVETYMAGVVGSDDFGAKIKKELESVSVKTENIETIFDQPTSVSFVLVNKSNGSRTIFSPASKDSGQARKYNYLMNPDVILFDGYEYTASREAIQKYPDAISIIDAETSSPEILELCKYAKYIVCSKNFAETMSKTKADFNDPKSLVNMYQNLRNRFPNKEIIVTLSEHGALYSEGDEIKIMPGLNRQVKDTTGAGDIFHGAFAYGMLNHFPIEKCVSYGNIAAGLSLDKIGVRNSIPSLNEVISVYNEKNQPTVGAPSPAAAPAAPQPTAQTPTAPATPAPAEVAPVEAPTQEANVPVAPTAPTEAAPVPQAPATPAAQAPATPQMAIPDKLPDVK
jgi:sugar/nucleoside kinase (ribokinase family)